MDEIVKKIKNRDSKSLKLLMDMCTNLFYKVCYSILISVGKEEDIEECVQDVFIHIWNNIYDFNYERGSFKTWVMVICKYKALDYRRKLLKNKEIEGLDELEVTSKEEVEGNIVSAENKREIVNWIKSLDEIDKEIFIKRYLLHQGIEDISNQLNMSRGAIDNRLWRGRKKLAEHLAKLRREEII
ncbi:sigma-70 family RNA polymerase sigma factor [Clostridium malenominatum]|uniref:Sigma-70 family RNA polymerase sigma factor n=1 Tax=Clostridium malenominatum TaxID=1539 RepID=A0ABN1IYN3_9CLOT